MKQTIAERLKSALESIAQYSKNSPNAHQNITLLAVSKTKPISDILAAYQAGQREFGENYVQEGVEKIQQLTHLSGIQWHMIGPLQSNKCKPVASHFDWVQSVDREKIARRLNDNRPEHLAPLNVCLQININEEDSKSGIKLQELFTLAEFVATSPRLMLRGIMAIPAKTEDVEQLNDTFQQLHDCFLQLQSRYPSVDTLSMGMSNDMQYAIANGSTMVRLGTAIFGERT
ncbi:MAG: YggS family pyridoxal phosphate-dependent enzyme [Aestuariibacter sp.]